MTLQGKCAVVVVVVVRLSAVVIYYRSFSHVRPHTHSLIIQTELYNSEADVIPAYICRQTPATRLDFNCTRTPSTGVEFYKVVFLR